MILSYLYHYDSDFYSNSISELHVISIIYLYKKIIEIYIYSSFYKNSRERV